MFRGVQYRFTHYPRGEEKRGELIDLSSSELKEMLDAAGMTRTELSEALGVSRRRMDKYLLNGFPRFVIMYLTLRQNIRSLFLAAEYKGVECSNKTLLELLEDTGLTYSNLAKVINVSPCTLRKWIREERMPKYAAETTYLFMKIGELFYATYGSVLKRRDFLPANKRYKKYPKGTKNMDGSPRAPRGTKAQRNG